MSGGIPTGSQNYFNKKKMKLYLIQKLLNFLEIERKSIISNLLLEDYCVYYLKITKVFRKQMSIIKIFLLIGMKAASIMKSSKWKILGLRNSRLKMFCKQTVL